MYIHGFYGRSMMDEKCFEMFWIPNPNLHNVSYRSIQSPIFTTVLILQFVGFRRSQPCMNGMATPNDRVRKIMSIFSFMVVKPPGHNGDAVRINFPSGPPFQNWQRRHLDMKLHQQSFNRNNSRNSSKNKTTRNSRCCSCPRARTMRSYGITANNS